MKDVSSAVLKKVSERLGSNEGGWYEDKEDGKRYYVKLYENPDQARIEYIANAIYAKLGILAVKSELFELDGKLAIASGEIPEAERTYREEQAGSLDIRKGFLADAYLANWDVVGLVYDNIVRDRDGRFYRVDNGGSLIFRAQGGEKDFSSLVIGELDSMRNPTYQAGTVFKDITENDLKEQAAYLVRSLSEPDIERIVSESGLSGVTAKKVLEGLKGRRQYLIQRFSLDEPGRDLKTKKKRNTSPEQLLKKSFREYGGEVYEGQFFPRNAFLSDGDKIENQQIDIVEGERSLFVYFKLTSDHYREISEMAAAPYNSGRVSHSTITYGGKKPYNWAYELVGANQIQFGSILVRLARREDAKDFRSGIGLVQIEIPYQRQGEKKKWTVPEVKRRLNRIMKSFFNIPTWNLEPDETQERAYKRARYMWHHKLSTIYNPESVERSLVRREVMPGYFTFVHPGAHEEYRAMSPYAVIHSLNSGSNLPSILKAGGLLATHERYRRGSFLEGISSSQDLEEGGGDSVFTRIVTEAGLEKSSVIGGFGYNDSSIIVFKSHLLDRTDWYAYGYDKYGRTTLSDFEERQAPTQIFEEQRESGFNVGNEQMFRLGISVKDMQAAVVVPREVIKYLVADLAQKRGFEQSTIFNLLKMNTENMKKFLLDAGIHFFQEEETNEVLGSAFRKSMHDVLASNDFLSESDRKFLLTKGGYYYLDQFVGENLDTIFEKLQELLQGRLLKQVSFIELLDRRAYSDLVQSLEERGIHEIAGKSTNDYIHNEPYEFIRRFLEGEGLFGLLAKGNKIDDIIDDISGKIQNSWVEKVCQLFIDRGITNVGNFSLEELFDARPSYVDLSKLLIEYGITSLKGMSVAELEQTERDYIIEKLLENGIREVNGKPLEEFVVYGSTYKDLIDISEGRPVRSIVALMQ